MDTRIDSRHDTAFDELPDIDLVPVGQARQGFVISGVQLRPNVLSVQHLGAPAAASCAPEMVGQLFDVRDTGIFDFPARDLFDRAMRDAGRFGDHGPGALRSFQRTKNETVEGFCHGANTKPMHGFLQPSNGRKPELSSAGMASRHKSRKIITPQAQRLRATVAENVVLLMEREFPLAKFKTKTAQQKALAQQAGCSWSTIQRTLDPEDKGTVLDLIADIASALGVRAADLLTHNFAAATLAPRVEEREQDSLQRRRR